MFARPDVGALSQQILEYPYSYRKSNERYAMDVKHEDPAYFGGSLDGVNLRNEFRLLVIENIAVKQNGLSNWFLLVLFDLPGDHRGICF